MHIKIGTRQSKLALIQTALVIKQIKKHYPNTVCEVVKIVTTGDLIQNINLYDIGGKALFLKEIEKALLDDKIDLAVHSLKDMPGRGSEKLMIGAMLEGEDSRDVLISQDYKSILELPRNTVVGTSSPRRKIFIEHLRTDLNIVGLRGNVDSRIAKLIRGEVDATILAAAGLNRLGLLEQNYCHIIPVEQMLPSAGQGVIAVQIKKDNKVAALICQQINHLLTSQLQAPGRAFLEYLDVSCRTPTAVYAKVMNSKYLHVCFMVSDFEGKNKIFHQEEGLLNDATALGVKAAKFISSKIDL